MKLGHGIVEATHFMKDHPVEALAIIKPRFGALDEKTLSSAFESYRAATPESLAPTAAILASSQNFEINTGLTKPGDKLASFDGMYSGDFVH
jgi:ABC-type nitrate/sulfonate/bicarbonate transport system substrate-binding protein